jgi:hypothetical protein
MSADIQVRLNDPPSGVAAGDRGRHALGNRRGRQHDAARRHDPVVLSPGIGAARDCRATARALQRSCPRERAVGDRRARMGVDRRRRRIGSALSALSLRELGTARYREDRATDGLSAARSGRGRVGGGLQAAAIGLGDQRLAVDGRRPDAGRDHPAVTPAALLFAGRLRTWRGLPVGGSGANP